MATAWRSKVLLCWWVRIKATTCVSSHCLSTCSYFRVPRSNLPIASYSIEPTFSISSIHLQSLFSLLSTGAGACYTASSDGVGVVQPPWLKTSTRTTMCEKQTEKVWHWNRCDATEGLTTKLPTLCASMAWLTIDCELNQICEQKADISMWWGFKNPGILLGICCKKVWTHATATTNNKHGCDN